MEVINDMRRVCRALLNADAEIRDIIQFGSSVYAKGSARDIDLLVTTRKKKDYGIYLDAAAECGLPAYAGDYLQGRAEQEYRRWRANVVRLVDDLEAAAAP